MSRAGFIGPRPGNRAHPHMTESDAAINGPVADAERAVLAAMTLDPEAVARARELIAARDFYRIAHQKIFTAILALADRGERADSIMVAAELARRGDLEPVGGMVAVTGLHDFATTSANLPEHARVVREASIKRRFRRLGLDLVHRAEDPGSGVADMIAHLDASAAALAASDHGGAGRFAEAAVGGPGLVARDIPRPRSLLGDGVLNAGGFGVVYGVPGARKTWLAFLLGRSLARGESWLGLPTAPEGVRVGVLQLELPAYQVQGRLRSLGIGTHHRDAGLRVVCRPDLKGAVDLLQPEHMADLRAWVIRDLDVLILDALSRVHRADENSAKEFGPVLAALDALRHETGAAVLAVHHEPKPRDGRDPDDDLSALRGTSRLASDPTLLMRVVRSRGLGCVRFSKVSEAAAPDPIWFRVDEDGLPTVVDSPESVRDGNREKVLRAVLTADRPLRNGEVAERVELSEATTRRHLGALVEAGQIHVEGEGRETRYTHSPAQPAHDATRAGQRALDSNGLDAEAPRTRSRSPELTRSPAQPAPLKGEQGDERVGETAGDAASGFPDGGAR